MKRLIASSLAIVAAAGVLAAPPALGQPEKKTELVELGKSVDSMLLRYEFDALWAVDDQHILLRDTNRDHYVVTLKESCPKLVDMQRYPAFFPALGGRVRASLSYEVRDPVGQPCDIAKVEQVDQARANELRAASKANG